MIEIQRKLYHCRVEIMGEKKPEMEQRSRDELQREVKDTGAVIEQFGFIGSPRAAEAREVTQN